MGIERLSVKITTVAVFTALALATNYALIGIANVKLMDTLVFVASFFFGIQVGLGVAVSIWPIYGFVNPYGVDSLLLLSFLMVGECFYAIAGLALRKTFIAQELAEGTKKSGRVGIVFGFAGLFATFAYDVLTNFGSWIFKTGSLYRDFIYGNVFGAPFSLVHELSNFILFVTVAPAIILAMTRLGFKTSRGLP